MAKRGKELSQQEAEDIYYTIYYRNVEEHFKRARDPITGQISDENMARIYGLKARPQKPHEIISAARAFGREEYKRKIKAYEEAMQAWTPGSGQPKPVKPHQDSLERYIARMANAQTRAKSPAQADSIVAGKFKVEVPYVDKRTGEIRYRKRDANRNDVYYSTPEQAEKWFWNPIRERRKQLLEAQKNSPGGGLSGRELNEYLAETIAQEFFGSK